MQKVALITGGARRIGSIIATYLHENGFKVIIHCNNSIEEANFLCKELNAKRENSCKVLKFSLDLSDNFATSVEFPKSSIEKIIAGSIAWGGRLDVVINNASVFTSDDSRFDEMFAINVRAPFLLSKAAYPHLKASNGCIVNITDSNVRKPIKNYASYCQTKAALSMQTRALALEFAPDVRVNAVAPGAVLWPEGENNLSQDKKDLIISKILLKRHGHPINIAKMVLSLINNDFITGQEIFVDGGRNI